MSKKLKVDDKVEIVTSREESLRKLADKYGVHHSTIDELFSESKEVLEKHWSDKKTGRPKKEGGGNAEIEAKEKELDKLKEEVALKQMKIDYLELKLKWAEEDAQKKKAKQLSVKKKKEMIALIESHNLKYPFIIQGKRLHAVGYTKSSFDHLKRSLRERKKRESSITFDDITEAIRQMIMFPFLGGKKGALKLLNEKRALIGETFYAEIKKMLKELCEEEVKHRKTMSELEKNKYSRVNEKAGEFKKIEAEAVDDIWSIDFVELWLLGIKFSLCVVYDVYSQSYLSIVPSFYATGDVALEAVDKAFEYRGTRPKKCILYDGGKQFLATDFQKRFDNFSILRNQTPPGSPWFNGALECGNRDLKKALYTCALYKASEDPGITKTGVDTAIIFDFLSQCCSKTKSVINEVIVRPKFRATPMQVINGQAAAQRKVTDDFKKKKLAERKLMLKKNGDKGRSLEKKVKLAWNKLKKELSNELLFACKEALNNRFHAVQV